MKVLIILNQAPYDGSDVAWNALRLGEKLLEAGAEVKYFLMNDAVDLARDKCVKPEFYDNDLVEMLKNLIAKGVGVEVCGTCQARCGILKNEPYFEGAIKSTMPNLANLVLTSDKVLTF